MLFVAFSLSKQAAGRQYWCAEGKTAKSQELMRRREREKQDDHCSCCCCTLLIWLSCFHTRARIFSFLHEDAPVFTHFTHCSSQCVTVPKIFTIPILFSGTKYLLYWFRDFFRYQILPIPVPRFFPVANFSNTGSDTTRKDEHFRYRFLYGTSTHYKSSKFLTFCDKNKFRDQIFPSSSSSSTLIWLSPSSLPFPFLLRPTFIAVDQTCLVRFLLEMHFLIILLLKHISRSPKHQGYFSLSTASNLHLIRHVWSDFS